MNITLSSHIALSPEVLFQEVGGEAVLLDLASETYFGLDPVGTRIWQLLDGHGGDLAAVRDAMLDEYEVEAERLEKDLLDLVARLAEAGLVRDPEEGHAPAP